MTSPPVVGRDVERIVRDVLTGRGFHASTVSAQESADGWHLVIVDTGGRVLRTDLPRGKPAAIRGTIAQWLDNAPIAIGIPIEGDES